MNRIIRVAALGGALALALAACGSAPERHVASSSSPSSSSGAAASDFKGCIVSDSGGFNDKSFNESALNGLNKVKSDLGIQTAQAESKTDDAYAPNIDNLVSQDCNMIVRSASALDRDGRRRQGEPGRRLRSRRRAAHRR